jgi:hypothetical protein
MLLQSKQIHYVAKIAVQSVRRLTLHFLFGTASHSYSSSFSNGLEHQQIIRPVPHTQHF